MDMSDCRAVQKELGNPTGSSHTPISVWDSVLELISMVISSNPIMLGKNTTSLIGGFNLSDSYYIVIGDHHPQVWLNIYLVETTNQLPLVGQERIIRGFHSPWGTPSYHPF